MNLDEYHYQLHLSESVTDQFADSLSDGGARSALVSWARVYRNDVTELCDEVERLTAEVERLNAELAQRPPADDGFTEAQWAAIGKVLGCMARKAGSL